MTHAGIARRGLIALLGFFACIALLHGLVPEYEPARRYLSEYALSRWGPLMTLAFALLAAGAWSTGAVLGTPGASPARRVASLCFRCYGVSMGVAGVFPSFLVPVSFGPAGPLHNISAQVAFLAVLVGLWCDAADARKWVSWILPGIAVLAWFHLMEQAATGGSAVGNAQRVYVLLTVGGMARIARREARRKAPGA